MSARRLHTQRAAHGIQELLSDIPNAASNLIREREQCFRINIISSLLAFTFGVDVIKCRYGRPIAYRHRPNLIFLDVGFLDGTKLNDDARITLDCIRARVQVGKRICLVRTQEIDLTNLIVPATESYVLDWSCRLSLKPTLPRRIRSRCQIEVLLLVKEVDHGSSLVIC